MTKKLQSVLSFSALAALLIPSLAFAQESSSLDTLFTSAGYLSMALFVVAAVMLFYVANLFKKTAMYAVLLYFAIGTAMIVAQSTFIALGAEFFGIDQGSLDVWWHFLFFMAFAYHFVGLILLTKLGTSEFDSDPEKRAATARMWGFIGLCVAVVEFIIPKWAENIMMLYTKSPLDSFGLHHFIAFTFAGIVAWYLFFARKNLGQVGKLIANPVIFAVTALSLQHLWELLNESWMVITVPEGMGEGIEKIFLITAACALIWGAWKLWKFKKGTTPAPAARQV